LTSGHGSDGNGDSAPPETGRRRIVYGRRRGHRLRRRRRELLGEHLSELSVDLEIAATEPRRCFETDVAALWLEIGFGGGEHLAHQATLHPDIGFIGSEPFLEGVAKLLARIEEDGLRNIRLWPDDARPLLEALPDRSVDRVDILFPDPWPKTRHHKRRLINDETVAHLARVLVDGATLRLATDHPEYARWMLLHVRRNPAFVWTARSPRDWRQRPWDAIATRYEEKAREAGRPPVYLTFARRPRTPPQDGRSGCGRSPREGPLSAEMP